MQCIWKTFPYNDGSLFAARKTDIIRVTEQILDAINSGDFEGYTYVFHSSIYQLVNSIAQCPSSSSQLVMEPLH